MVSKKTAIQRDLDRHVSDKFQRWLIDSMETYAIADIPIQETTAHVVFCGLSSAVSAMMPMGAKPESMHLTLDIIIGRTIKELRKADAS